MTASALSPTTAPAAAVRPPTALVDASTRWPVLLMASASVKWLVLALIAGILALPKLHGPGMLAGIPALTFGRLIALQDAVFIWGFASQAAMAISLWLICRLGSTPLVGRGTIVIATIVWNFGVLVGAVGILAGNMSPFAHFQFPLSAFAILLTAYLAYAICALLTFAARRECLMYPSLWFVFAGLIFLPWVLGSAVMTLWSPTVRGSALPIIAGWAANNITTVWLGSIAIAAIYYFLPKISGKTLYSYGTAVFAFWLYVMFGQATGMHANAALPAWVVTTSEICTILLVLPAIANAMNWWFTVNNSKKVDDTAYRLTWWAALLFVGGAILAAIAAYRPINLKLEFTVFQMGLSALFLYGFVMMSFLGAFAYILPRITEFAWLPSFRWHFTMTFAGVFLLVVGFLVPGLIQSGKDADIGNDYASIVHSAAMPMGLAIIGLVLILIGQFAWLSNVARICCSCCCSQAEGGRR